MSAWQTLGGEGGCLLKLRPDNWDHSPTFPEQMEGGGTRGHCCRSWSSKGGGALLERGQQEEVSLPVTCFPVSTGLVVRGHLGSHGLGGRAGGVRS